MKDTNAVICGNLLIPTSKQKRALELGIKIYTPKEFKQHFKVC